MNSLTDYLDFNGSSSNSSSPNVDTELMIYNQQGLNYELSRYDPYEYSIDPVVAPLAPPSVDDLAPVPQFANPVVSVPHSFDAISTPPFPTPPRGVSGHRRLDSQIPVFDSPRKRRRDSTIIIEDNELKRIAYDLIDSTDTGSLHRLETASLSERAPQSQSQSQPSASEPQEGHAHETQPSLNLLSKESKRQIFAMVWLIQNCQLSPTSVVPRNRVYSKYVGYYSNFNIFPLTPASLGKLIRVLFPNLNIRRLGVRGQSKYHYCGIKLINDKYEIPNLLADHTPFDINQMLDSLHIVRYQYRTDVFETIKQHLKTTNFNGAINLPDIYPFVPKDTDLDIADTLFALYKINHLCVVESLRFMDINAVYNNFSNFMSILTSPVFKLYTHHLLYEWVYLCDLSMYRLMLKMIYGTLDYFISNHNSKSCQDLLAQFRDISSQFRSKLFQAISNKLPTPLLTIKMSCADFFIKSLNKFISFVGLTWQIKQNRHKIALPQIQHRYHKIQFLKLFNKLPFDANTISTLVSVFQNDVPEVIDHFTIKKLLPIMDAIFSMPIGVRTMKVYIISVILEVFKALVTESTQDVILAKFWIQDYLDLYLEATGLVDTSGGQEVFDNKSLKQGLDLLNLKHLSPSNLTDEDATSPESDQQFLAPKLDTEYVIGKSRAPEDTSAKYPQSPEESFDTFEKSFGEFVHIKKEYMLDLES